MLKRITFIAVVCMVAAASAWADGVELTPILGYRFGGDINGLRAPDGSEGSFSIEDGNTYGLIADFDFVERAALELSYARQSADLTTSSSFDHLATPDKIDIDHYQLGVLFYLRLKNKAIRPFFSVAIGAENFAANNGFDNQSTFSVAGGAGAKFYFGNHFGVRVQASLISAQIPGGNDAFCQQDGPCYTKKDTGSVNQGELTAGLIFKF